MMEPILGEFEDLVRGVQLSAPKIPFVSTLNGEWADGPVMQSEYWSAQLRSTVRFADGLQALMKADSPAGKDPIFLEVGPGKTLVTFATQTARVSDQAPLCLTSLPSPDERRSDIEMMLSGLGQLWANGVEVDWSGFHSTEGRRRVSLPTYPFERRSYWVGELVDRVTVEASKPRDTSKWFQRPVWRTAPPVKESVNSLESRRILVFDEQTGLGAAVIGHLSTIGAQPVAVRQGKAFESINEGVHPDLNRMGTANWQPRCVAESPWPASSIAGAPARLAPLASTRLP
jgi:acyl transferase domain-containing protein